MRLRSIAKENVEERVVPQLDAKRLHILKAEMPAGVVSHVWGDGALHTASLSCSRPATSLGCTSRPSEEVDV
jgi:hypothetical protein